MKSLGPNGGVLRLSPLSSVPNPAPDRARGGVISDIGYSGASEGKDRLPSYSRGEQMMNVADRLAVTAGRRP